MADADIGNSHNEEIVRYEHGRKNVGAKRVVLYGYDANTDEYYPITPVDNGDGTYSLKVTGGSSGGGGLTDAELRASPVEVTGTVSTTAPVGGATEEEQLSQTDILLGVLNAMNAVARAKGIASDLRVTLLGGTTAVTGALTSVATVSTVANLAAIGGINAVPTAHNIQNQAAVQSNINNVIVS